jgi:DNA-binding transcriptional ArsR family regulator
VPNLRIMSQLNTDHFEKVAFVLKTIGHPVRLGIINLLSVNQKLSVNDLCQSLNVEQSVISHHLNNMKQKGIIDCRKDGKQRHYYLLLEEVLTVVECMQKCKL